MMWQACQKAYPPEEIEDSGGENDRQEETCHGYMRNIDAITERNEPTPDSRGDGVNRRTVKKYKAWAEEHDLLTGELPPLEELQGLLDQTMPETEPPQNVSSVEPYRAKVEQWVKEKVEVAAIHKRLKEQGYQGSYMACIALCNGWRATPCGPQFGWSSHRAKKPK